MTVKIAPRHRLLSLTGIRAGSDDPSVPIVYAGTTEMVDAHDSLVLRDGIILDDYLANPVVLVVHRNEPESEIGRSDKVVPFDAPVKGLDFHVRFLVTGHAEDAPDRAYRMARAGLLRGASIAWVDARVRWELSDTERALLGLGPWGYIVEQCRLRELSLAPWGSNPGALQRALDARTITEGDAETYHRWAAAAARRAGQAAPEEPTEEPTLGEVRDELLQRLARIEGGLPDLVDTLSDVVLGQATTVNSYLEAIGIGFSRIEASIVALSGTLSPSEAKDLERCVRHLRGAVSRVTRDARRRDHVG